jgi:hypothetical protein
MQIPSPLRRVNHSQARRAAGNSGVVLLAAASQHVGALKDITSVGFSGVGHDLLDTQPPDPKITGQTIDTCLVCRPAYPP